MLGVGDAGRSCSAQWPMQMYVMYRTRKEAVRGAAARAPLELVRGERLVEARHVQPGEELRRRDVTHAELHPESARS